ncbi:VanZ family protein [Natranaerovirga hydrolytica]|uniref:VanZ family protein n=1 Tax=Natranaerovirga hydrolytica TaxID=680378 RepID=UPI0014025616|nr:VanZ family protein [Natranaerovirga hydrolytica]
MENEKEDLKIEFLDHLNLLKKEYIDKGKSESEAIDLSLKVFGNKETITFELNKSTSKLCKLLKKVFVTIWWVYILFVVWALILGRSSNMIYLNNFKGINIIPFKQIGNYILMYPNGYSQLSNMFVSIILFIPFGFFIPIIVNKGKNIKNNLLFAFAFSFCIEWTQYMFSRGIFDIDDIILNLTGSIIGLGVYKLLLKVLKRYKMQYLIRGEL